MKMNKTLAAALAIVTASTLGLSGCGSAGGDVKKTADGKVQITMSVSYTHLRAHET